MCHHSPVGNQLLPSNKANVDFGCLQCETTASICGVKVCTVMLQSGCKDSVAKIHHTELGSVAVGSVEVTVHSCKAITFAVRAFQKPLILPIIAKQIPSKQWWFTKVCSFGQDCHPNFTVFSSSQQLAWCHFYLSVICYKSLMFVLVCYRSLLCGTDYYINVNNNITFFYKTEESGNVFQGT